MNDHQAGNLLQSPIRFRWTVTLLTPKRSPIRCTLEPPMCDAPPPAWIRRLKT